MTVTRCEFPRIVSWPVAVVLTVAPEAKARGRVTGWVRVKLATGSALPDGEVRDQVQSALAQSEHDRVARIAKAWEYLASLLGYRLRPEAAGTYETPVILANATMRGLIVIALSTPELAARRIAASPFGAASTNEWSLPALGLASIASAFLEPDPAVEWDAERVVSVRQALSTLSMPDG